MNYFFSLVILVLNWFNLETFIGVTSHKLIVIAETEIILNNFFDLILCVTITFFKSDCYLE